ncbi:MAG: TetR/AcrR family transcriptional regulator [Oscillospiraceae bacterium]
MSKHENPMAIRSKVALTSALLKLMMSRGFDEISVSDITDKAGLSRQTFYTNFGKREDILDYLLAGLFEGFTAKIEQARMQPSNLIIDYLLYWDSNKSFLSLLFAHGMGHMFQAKNREYFMESAEILDGMYTSENWQLPYIKASLSGLTYELLWMWIMNDQGLGIDVLSALAENLLSGRIFAEAE